MDPQDHAIYSVWIHFIPTSLYPRREKTIWSELESKPGPLASQASDVLNVYHTAECFSLLSLLITVAALALVYFLIQNFTSHQHGKNVYLLGIELLVSPKCSAKPSFVFSTILQRDLPIIAKHKY